MTILGIDPGTVSAGYAVISFDHTPSLETCGLFKIEVKERAMRLRELHRELTALIRRWRPDEAAVERLYFSKNSKTAMEVSEARGVILLTTALASLEVAEYTPLEIKKKVAGDGRADKVQIQKIIRMTLPGAKLLTARDDVFDAIATALAHCYTYKQSKIYNR